MTTKITTTKHWPEGRMPTPEEYRDWYVACTTAEQIELARRVMHDAGVATRCVLEDHDALLQELEAMTVRMRRYRLAWASARRWRRAYRTIMAGFDAQESTR